LPVNKTDAGEVGAFELAQLFFFNAVIQRLRG
jgi:hypothetical protein